MVGVSSALATVSVASMRAQAFALTGMKWDTDRYGYACDDYGASLFVWNPCHIDVSQSSNFDQRFGWYDSATAADENWYVYDYSRGRDTFHYDNVSGNSALVSMDAANLGYSSTSTYTIGYTTWYGVGGELSSVAIQINDNSNVPWWTVDSGGSGADGSHLNIVQSMTHELGHALGLHHPTRDESQSPLAVMECLQAYGENHYTQPDDLNGVLYIYSGHGGDYGSPGPRPVKWCTR
ncbi:MAG: matrixin family metalloprotease [Candidatus Dormibacteraceae bacterium]